MRHLILLVAVPLLLDLGTLWALSSGPAAPAPHTGEPAIFFDWDGTALSPHARQTLAVVGHGEAGARIRIGGDPGASGGAYRLALARRRSDRVVGELLADGVAPGRIAVHADTVLVAGRLDLAMR